MVSSPGRQAKMVAPHYVLGEQTVPYDQIPGWQQRAAAFSMPELPGVWGWGAVRETTTSFVQLAVESAAKTLAASPDRTADTVIFCSSSLPADADEQTRLLCTFADALQLNQAEIIGVTLGRCTNLLKGLRLAQARIASGQSAEILLIASDYMADPQKRLENFALFSDGAASCLITHSNDPRPGFDILASAEKQDLTTLTEGLSAALAKAVNQQLFSATQMDITDISRLFHTNVYLPLCNLKERQAGYRAEQLFTDNIARIGHCFSADPLINLIDADAAAQLPARGIFQLAASIPGARASVLLQKRKEK
ncbi:beta-ketoacyl-[acyl-carrier-protein] synthase family protein [Erwinia psidii]|uniref:3-oxoacyl-ACP synthase n=1 Tax=Erwinia psidii TaxID=69224 RepID=A0A3N6SDM9_9GAMM|nr:3-oxoacyl-ACP synthase [Erwinia psidii]MCX8957634.1 3-oxoacyl-ACP synthase [Erwinia psidii]MCX8960688.1 3-oxoacyl-ACP synthase [Erwinia psidii]MCX8964067.1 3-oxoacyl-ACP synthase [Erwinia psidii]RQM39550.1 3-oxoacyl-ACP synthase [Erwinia psidii]